MHVYVWCAINVCVYHIYNYMLDIYSVVAHCFAYVRWTYGSPVRRTQEMQPSWRSLSTQRQTHTHTPSHTRTHFHIQHCACIHVRGKCFYLLCGRGSPLSWLNIKLTPHLTIYMLISSCGWAMGCIRVWGILSCGCLSIAYRGHNLALA